MRRQFLLLSSLLVLLVGCAPIQNLVQDAVAQVGRGDDGAVMYLTSSQLIFDPVGAAGDVTIFIGGDPLAFIPVGCEAENHGAYCVVGDVSKPVVIPVGGVRLSANVAYERGGVYHAFYVRENHPSQ